MMKQHRDGVVSALATALAADKVSVEAFYGRFTEEALKQFVVKAPAVRISIVAVERVEHSEGMCRLAWCRYAAVIITRDQSDQRRDGQALDIAAAIMDVIAGLKVPSVKSTLAMDIRAENLFPDAVGNVVQMWGVSWLSGVQIGQGEMLGPAGFPEIDELTQIVMTGPETMEILSP